jgi:hypothetical protein
MGQHRVGESNALLNGYQADLVRFASGGPKSTTDRTGNVVDCRLTEAGLSV